MLRDLAEHQRWRRTEAATADYVEALKMEQAVAVAEAQRAAAQALEDTAALRAAYEEHMNAKGAWQQRESEEVHMLRAENSALGAQVEEMREGILSMQERLEALLVAAYDEIRADLSGDSARRGKLEVHCERLELESRMAWQSLRRIAGSHSGESSGINISSPRLAAPRTPEPGESPA